MAVIGKTFGTDREAFGHFLILDVVGQIDHSSKHAVALPKSIHGEGSSNTNISCRPKDNHRALVSTAKNKAQHPTMVVEITVNTL